MQFPRNIHSTAATSLRGEEFLAVLAHDLRGPVSGIIGFLQLLRSTSLDADQRDYCDTCLGCCADLRNLLDALLECARTGEARPDRSEVHLPELLAPSIEILRHHAGSHGLDFRVSFVGNVETKISIDPAKLRQIVLNLCGNAIKFTRAGFVALTLERSDHDAEPFLTLTVEDTGSGLSESARTLLRGGETSEPGPDARTQAPAGLGLRIVRHLVSVLGGTITAERRTPKGTRIAVGIPCAG